MENVKKDNEGTPWECIYRERTAVQKKYGEILPDLGRERLSQVLERKAFGGGGKAGGGSHAAEASWREFLTARIRLLPWTAEWEGNGMAKGYFKRVSGKVHSFRGAEWMNSSFCFRPAVRITSWPW